MSVIWRGYIKDQLDLEAKPKAYVKILTYNINEDLLISAASSFDCVELPSNISKGDILVVQNTMGKTMYQGVISSVEDTTINTNQIFNIYAGTWLYDLPSWLGNGDNKSWILYNYGHILDGSEDSSFGISDIPSLDDLTDKTIVSTNTILDSNISISMNLGEHYTAHCVTYVYSDKRKKLNVTYGADNGMILYVNSKKIGSALYKSAEEYLETQEVVFKQGWNTIEVVYTEITGGDGFSITIDGNKLSNVFSKMTSNYITSVDSLEERFAHSLKLYSNGEMRDSSYVDPLIKQRLGNINITAETKTKGCFLSEDDSYTVDMEQIIYDLYKNYHIMLDINIKYEGQNSVIIKKVSDEGILKVADNINSLVDMTPTTEVTETNRLIIYDSNGMYRSTYATKADGSRVKEPSNIANRFGIVNTKIVFSDDPIDDLLDANLPTEIYNHKLTFTLKLNGNIFSFDDFKLGTPLKVWVGSDYYQTIVTGRTYSKEENEDITEVTYTCGNVRTKMTDKLLQKFGIIR